jgi:hypothetical protein
MKSFFVAAVVLGIGLVATADPGSQPQELRPAVVVFPEFHERSATAQAAWIGYATALAHLAMNSSENPAPGLIEPSFDQEVAARQFMVSVWVGNLEDEKAPLDPYLEDLRRVEEAGFMREYAWVYLRRSYWASVPLDLKLDLFEQWSAEHLHSHVRQLLTAGRLDSEETAPAK